MMHRATRLTPAPGAPAPAAGGYAFLATAVQLLAADEGLRGSWAAQPAPELQQQLEELLARKLPTMDDLAQLMPQVRWCPRCAGLGGW
jgi:hypothetical protein